MIYANAVPAFCTVGLASYILSALPAGVRNRFNSGAIRGSLLFPAVHGLTTGLFSSFLVGTFHAVMVGASVAAMQGIGSLCINKWQGTSTWLIVHAIQVVALLPIARLAGIESVPLGSIPWLSEPEFTNAMALTALVGSIGVVVSGGKQMVGRAVKPYLDEIANAIGRREDSLIQPRRGLTQAGRVIGRIERFLAFLFVLMGTIDAIGFLMAAKSLLRFDELRKSADRMESEYIIIGTLMSFAYALSVGWLCAGWVRFWGLPHFFEAI